MIFKIASYDPFKGVETANELMNDPLQPSTVIVVILCNFHPYRICIPDWKHMFNW